MTAGAHWLTAKRLAAHGLLLATAIWSVYVWALATPGLRDRNGNVKGTDFLHLYTLGWLARTHDGPHLYDIDYQAAVVARRVPGAAGIRYLPLYPPQVSLIFAPFAFLGYEQALGLWWAMSAGIYAACCYWIWRTCANLRGHRALVLLLALAFPGFFNLIAWGQTSALALACFTGGFLLLRKQRDFLAGVVLGCLVYKPQLGLGAAVVFSAVGAWKVVAGGVLGSAVELSGGALYYGLAPIQQWLTKVWDVRPVLALFEPRPYQTHCLRTFWSMILPSQNVAFAMYVLTSIAILALTIAIWRARETTLEIRYSALLLATVLVSPHLTVYDLVILAPIFLILAEWVMGQSSSAQSRIGTVLYLVYALPLVAPLTRWTHVQLSVVAMTVLMYMLWQALNNETAKGPLVTDTRLNISAPAQ